jgi:RimJ/RimL family protein N-acetyltransferase
MVVSLRPLAASDLPILFEQQRDPEANRRAAFGAADPDDRAAFDAHWKRILADPEVEVRTIETGGEVAGCISRWRDPELDAADVSFWLGSQFWGRGIATAALAAFLSMVPDERLYGRAASTNPGSVRVLERNGFRLVRVERDVPLHDGGTVDELILLWEREPSS